MSHSFGAFIIKLLVDSLITQILIFIIQLGHDCNFSICRCRAKFGDWSHIRNPGEIPAYGAHFASKNGYNDGLAAYPSQKGLGGDFNWVNMMLRTLTFFMPLTYYLGVICQKLKLIMGLRSFRWLF